MSIPDLFRRYMWLIDTLYRHDGLTMDEINAKWLTSDLSCGERLPRATFHRYRDDIQGMFDINISCNLSNYKYFIENKRDIRRGSIQKWMLDTISVGRMVAESHSLNKRVLLENIPSGQNFLVMITEAMKHGNTLMMEYQRFGHEPYTVEVAPYCVKLYHQRWYMLSRKKDSEHLTIYALDRMRDLQETENKFEVKADFDAEDFFSPYFGVITGDSTPMEHVVLHASHSLANYYRTLPIHHSMVETKETEDWVEFTVDVCPTYDFIQEIMSQMDSIKVIEPLWLRDKIRDTLIKTLEGYNGTTESRNHGSTESRN